MSSVDLFCGFSYVDDTFIQEARSWKRDVKSNTIFFAVCSITAVAVIIGAIMMAFFFKGGFSDGKQPITNVPIIEETEVETESQTEAEVSQSAEYIVPFELNRDFTTLVYGYAGEMVEITDAAKREWLCGVIESVPVRRATEEEKAEYNEMEGHYSFNLGDVWCAMTSRYLMISGNGLFCFEKEDGFEMIEAAIESVVNQ